MEGLLKYFEDKGCEVKVVCDDKERKKTMKTMVMRIRLIMQKNYLDIMVFFIILVILLILTKFLWKKINIK